MKPAFLKLSPQKRMAIIEAAIDEFAELGYNNSSTDGIIRRAGISKGALYEYIESKDELFLYIMQYAYEMLYDNLIAKLGDASNDETCDMVQRIRQISEQIIDFYLANPRIVLLLANNHLGINPDLQAKVQDVFRKNFNRLFTGNLQTDNLAHDKKLILGTVSWLILKTRLDFVEMHTAGRKDSYIRSHYLAKWEFYLSILKNGIYKS